MKYLLLLLALTACTPQGDSGTGLLTTTTTTLPIRIPLYWENTTESHPERKPWTDLLVANLRSNLSLYSSASDITELCPKYNSLSDDLKVKALGELWVAMAYYESSFNPASASKDVGTEADKGSWSVGLYQMSANDASCSKFGYTFTTLKDPLNNIRCATEQMRMQLIKRGEIFIVHKSPMFYWAVILEKNPYQKIPEIKARVLKYAPSCK